MKRFRWSRLYPKRWQREFGEDFDATTEQCRIGFKEASNIFVYALVEHAKIVIRYVPYLVGWAGVGFMNVYAHEVQWAAGSLLLCTAVATAIAPRGWFKYSVLFFLAVPISSLYTYQIPGIHHAPLYQTIVALIPALIGSSFGLVARYALINPIWKVVE